MLPDIHSFQRTIRRPILEKIRVQPPEPDVAEENPLQYDLLGRGELAKTLTHLVSTIEGPCVIALDAPWGSGKTTFLKMWSQHMHNEGLAVIRFNAWETDFSEDPFVALCGELTGSIDAEKGTELSSKINDVKKIGQVVFRHLASNALRRISLGLMDYNTLKEDLEKQPEESQIQQTMDEYQDVKKALVTFRQALQDMANE